ncbi:MAG: aldose 1-epimerase [Pseudomonadota bacterium]
MSTTARRAVPGGAPRTHVMRAGDLAATFLPEYGMLGTSLTHRGEELLRFPVDIDRAARDGTSIGIPINYPYANRLRTHGYAVLGRRVELDPGSDWLITDWNGTLLHGVRWARLEWEEQEAGDTVLASRLRWDRPELLAVFPFRHEVSMRVALDGDGLTVETTVHADQGEDVPVSFGFHPYIALPGLPRERWRLMLPRMQAMVLDELLIPIGEREDFPAYDHRLADLDFDHGFAFTTHERRMAIAGAGRRISVEFLEGFPYAQIYAPPAHDYISLEPMTAPANALVTGEDLPIVRAGGSYRAVFRIEVGAEDEDRRVH